MFTACPTNFKYLCTLRISRKTLGLQSNSLDSLARALNLGYFKHHNALEDAAMCAKLFEILREHSMSQNSPRIFWSQRQAARRI
ncbi:MAG: exonuclease domain-containing protein [Bacilli bacterium]